MSTVGLFTNTYLLCNARIAAAMQNISVGWLLCNAVVLSKIKVSFNTTVVRLEHLPKDAETGMSLEIHVARYGIVWIF